MSMRHWKQKIRYYWGCSWNLDLGIITKEFYLCWQMRSWSRQD